MAEQFWMVWKKGTQSPVKQHTSIDLAIAEARRLAEANPNNEFFVLMALHCYKGEVTVCSTSCSNESKGGQS